MRISEYLKNDRNFCDCGGYLEGYGWWLRCCKCGKKYKLQVKEVI